MIKENRLDAKFVLNAIKPTFGDRNHHVGRFSYLMVNACVENCGLSMNDPRTKNKYLKELKSEILNCPHPDIRMQTLISLQKWDLYYAQYRIFKKGERYSIVADGDSTRSKKRARKKRAPNGSIRKAKTPYRLYMKIKTQMLYGAKKGLHMKKNKGKEVGMAVAVASTSTAASR